MADEGIGSRKGGDVRIRSNILVLSFSSSVIKNQLGKALSTKTNYYLRGGEGGEKNTGKCIWKLILVAPLTYLADILVQ